MAFLKVRLCSMLFSWKKITIHTHTLMANEMYDTAVCQRTAGGGGGINPP